MAAATSIAIAGLIAGTGGRIAQQVLANRATDKAIRTQTTAADAEARRAEANAERERAYLERERERIRADYAPFMAMGNNALAQIGRGMGVPMQPGGNGLPSMPTGTAALAGIRQPGERIPGAVEPLAPSGNALAGLVARRRGGAGYRPTDDNMAVTAPEVEPTVRMQAPDGSVRAVPRRKVEMYRARGARVLE